MAKKAELVPVKTRVPRSTLRTLKRAADANYVSLMAYSRRVLIDHADFLAESQKAAPTKPQKTKRK